MGANQFAVRGEAWTAEEAFRQAVEEAQYEHGHGGYSGTIAEKDSFRTRTPPTLDTTVEAWRAWYDQIDEGHDKWGPAECVVLREPEEPRRLTKAQAEKLARERFGESAEIVVTRARGAASAVVGVGSRVMASAQGKDAGDARGRLFAKKGLYLFFGWASS